MGVISAADYAKTQHDLPTNSDEESFEKDIRWVEADIVDEVK